MNFITDPNALPQSPKRMAKAAAESGWRWNASYASGTLCDSLVVRTANNGLYVSARWESVDGGSLSLAYCAVKYPRQYPKELGLNEAIALIRSAVVS